MQKQLICLNLTNKIDPINDPRWFTNYLPDTGPQFSIDDWDKTILCVIADDENKLKKYLEQALLMNANVPTLFVIGHQCLSLVPSLVEKNLIHLFNLDGPLGLVKEFIHNMFAHYEQFMKARPNTIAQKINTSRYTKKELLILDLFNKSPQFKVSRHDVFKHVWGKVNHSTNTLDVHICNLRKKLKEDNIKIETIENGHIQLIH
jgi:hypothetical protein